jgi:hypothetical protein
MAPNAENPPASTAEQPVDLTVAGHVAGDFALPILPVSPGHAAVPRAAVPKAAVNEDSQALTPENEIGVAKERWVAAPASDSGGTQNGDQP